MARRYEGAGREGGERTWSSHFWCVIGNGVQGLSVLSCDREVGGGLRLESSERGLRKRSFRRGRECALPIRTKVLNRRVLVRGGLDYKKSM